MFGNDDLTIEFENYTCQSKFAEGKSINYNYKSSVDGK